MPFGGNTSADNGWKYVTAGNARSPYDFTVDYALLTSSAGGGDVIQYFVVAQDGAANFASSPSGASYSSAAAPVTTINTRPATVQTYRIISTDLSALTLSSGTLAPGFAANLTSYTATMANSVNSLLVTPTTADSTATVTVNGSTPASPVGLSVGASTLTIVVTASDSTTKTYTVTVTRAGLPDIAVAQTSAVADGGSVDFGTVTVGSSSAAKTFTITNPGTGDLTTLAFATADGANPGDFTVSALSGTSVPVGSGSVTFTVTFTPSASGTRSAAIHITSNVTGAKNPFDITLTGTGQTLFEAWAMGNGVANDINALGTNGIRNLLNFAFGVSPVTGGAGALVFNGTFGAGGTIGANGQPMLMLEGAANGADLRALYVRRKDAAAAGLTYSVEFSNATLGIWVATTAVPTVLADDGAYQIVSVPYLGFVAGKKARFFRVSVTIAP